MDFKDAFATSKSEITQKIFGFKITAYDYHTIKHLFKEIFLSNEYHFYTTKSSPQIY